MTFNPEFSISLPLVRVEGVAQGHEGLPHGLCSLDSGPARAREARYPPDRCQKMNCGKLDQTLLVSVGRCLGAVAGGGLVEDVAHMVANGPDANE